MLLVLERRHGNERGVRFAPREHSLLRNTRTPTSRVRRRKPAARVMAGSDMTRDLAMHTWIFVTEWEIKVVGAPLVKNTIWDTPLVAFP